MHSTEIIASKKIMNDCTCTKFYSFPNRDTTATVSIQLTKCCIVQIGFWAFYKPLDLLLRELIWTRR